MRVLVLGSNGQVGYELKCAFADCADVVALDRHALDLTAPRDVSERIASIGPDVVINAAAYTAVDRAESEEHAARQINGDAVGVIAESARRLGALIVHYSTDYVFDGSKMEPYVEDDPTFPLNAYGRSKRQGEVALFGSGANFLCLRTSWVYASRGSNFFLTMMRLADERDVVRVVDDQIGAPTWARTIAETTRRLTELCLPAENRARLCGLYHLASRGQTTWFGFADKIMRLREAHGLRSARVEAITSSEYLVAARRPLNSRLAVERLEATFGMTMPDWRVSLEQVFAERLANAS